MQSSISHDKGDVQVKLLLVFAATFTTLWVGSVTWGVNQVTKQIDRLTYQQGKFSDDFSSYVTRTEARLTALEVQAGSKNK